jgi:hypothetical protein
VGKNQSFIALKLEESGLSDHSDSMALSPFDAGGAKDFGVQDMRAGFALPYFDLDGVPIDFHRVRFERVPDGSMKYSQPPGSGVHVYFPRTLGATWRQFLELGKAKLTITEGELKAACACAHGIPTIGLGGVCSFTSKSGGLHHELAQIDWDERQVEIVYDSDLATNHNVRQSLRKLARMLEDQGAKVASVQLPEVLGLGKTGLDDYLVAHGPIPYSMLDRVAPDELAAKLDDYSQRYAVSDDGKGGLCVYDLEHPGRAPLKTGAWEKKRQVDVMLDPNDPKGKRKIYPAKLYFDSPERLEVHMHDYVPGGDRPLHDGRVNVWTGRGCDPWPEAVTHEDVAPWQELMEYIFGHDLERRVWFEQWCAYPLQNPGSKMYSAAFLYSPVKGVGKTILADTLSLIYGQQNVSRPTASQFGSDFNGWMAKEFVFVDELDTGDRKLVGSNIRNVVTAEFIDVNEKFFAVVRIKNSANLLLCSNHADSIEIDHDERRFFVHRISAKAPKPIEFYVNYRAYFLGEKMEPPYPDGLRKLYRYFLDLEMGGFNPRAKALKTDELEASIEVSQNDFEHWLNDVVDSPEEFAARVGAAGCDLFTLGMIENEYRIDRPMSRYSTRFLATTLKDYPGVVLAGRGDHRSRLNTCHGKQKLYAVRNQDKWDACDSTEAREHFDLHFDVEGAEL